MPNPPVPSAEGYGEVVENTQQTLTVASTIVELVREPVRSFLARKNARAALYEGLGEWAEQAFDATNHCQQPVLREEAFLRHLFDNKARFQPSGLCRATFAWAKLLYSLDVRPDSKIIEWQPLGKDADPAESGTIELELEGSVLCHIVNLYQIYDNPYGASLERLHDRGVTWQFSFGDLTIHPGHNSNTGNGAARIIPGLSSWTVTFRPSSNYKLSATREPFMTKYNRNIEKSGGPLAFEPNTVAINYVSTAQHCTYSHGVLGLPDPNDSLRSRCLSLYSCLSTFLPLLGNYGSGPNSYELWRAARSKPYLVTPSWIEQANRIKRRLTTNGGVDDGLAEYMVGFLARNPDAVERMTDYLGHWCFPSVSWQDAVRDKVKDLCFYKEDTFMFAWDMESPSMNGNSPESVVMNQLPHALKFLSQESPRTWLSPLAEMVPEVMRVLRCRTIPPCPVLVVGLTSAHTLWKSTCYVQGHVPTR